MHGTIFNKFYPGLLSAICLLAILWLTLAPRPVPVTADMFIPYADKVAHFLMFGGLMFCLVIDRDLWYQRRYEQTGRLPRCRNMVLVLGALAVALTGALTEVLQDLMDAGRGGDTFDFLADVAGTVVAALVSPHLSVLLLHRKSR